MRYIKTIGLLLVIALAIVGCGVVEKTSAEGKVIDGQEVMAKVNDEYVLKSEFQKQVDQVKSALEANGQDFSTDDGKKVLKEIKEKVLEVLVKDKLTLQEAKKANVSLTEEELKEAINQLEQYHGGTEALENYLKQIDLTRDKFEKILEEQLIINRFKEQLTSHIKVSDDEVKKYYEENKAIFQLPSPEIRASHILVEKEEEAKKIHEQLKAGADFAKLAKEHSIDGSKELGGDLGFFGKGKMVPEFEKAAFALKPGEISDIVKSQFGYHIIKVTDERTSLSYEDVKEYTKSNLENTKKEEEFEKHISKWEKQSKIEKYL